MKPILRQGLRYAAVGVVNSVFGLTIIFVLMLATSMSEIMCNFAGFAGGFFMSFLLNRYYTFRNEAPVILTLPLFLVVNGLAYGLNVLVLMGALSVGINSFAAQVLGVGAYAIAGFAGSRFLVFKE